MILIFNKAGMLFLFLGAMAAWVVAFVLWALGSSGPWTLISFCGFTGGVDIASRYIDVFKTGSSWLRVVQPSAGGQLFFVPVWILATALLVLASIS